MSENIFEPLVDTFENSTKILLKYSKKYLGLNIYDFNDLFKKINFKNKADEYPKLINIENEEYFKVYLFRLPVGITLSDFKNKSENIAFFLGVKDDVLRFETKENFNIAVKVMTKTPSAEYDPLTMKRNDFKIPLGYNLNNNKMVYWDLISSSNTHCYIAGSSGGGKSITLRLILTHLINSLSKRDIEFSIINTKRVDLKDFRYAKHTKHYMTGIDGVEDFLRCELEEMEKRYKLLERNDCDDLTEYRKKICKIPYRIIVVEEISSYKGNKEYQRAIELIASQGRGAGMILLLVTQLPSREIMPNTIKCNINTTIGLKTKDAIRSEIIAGTDSGLEKLKGNGHSKLFNGNHDGTEYQGLYISKEVMKDIIKNNCIKEKGASVAGTTNTPDKND
ncbi:FtsK/SpoIIIE domain-containing protein [Romboutsia lituseburensis]|uniref:FtsK/SpoIIIE domain-containing protein n=1 Tax=Romboutsia lituseburensis TaxID=1537 RepID=UPI00215B73B6|nr:FtsK/SpoIIIE domain-containing protein [Romboutsia lituseburensis]MCR8744378.1 FtsK/SpoIIIE domain-containing protein [Romboutsia lituseburensis]